MTHQVKASLGSDGLPAAMAHRVVSPSHMLYIFPRGIIKAEGDWARPIAPPATYDGMAVANGQDAGLAWEALIRGTLDITEQDKVRKALLDYCGQDTVALLKLMDKLRLFST